MGGHCLRRIFGLPNFSKRIYPWAGAALSSRSRINIVSRRSSTRNHELLMHSHLFAAARGLLASGEQVIDVTFKFTFLRGEGWRAASGGGELTYLR